MFSADKENNLNLTKILEQLNQLETRMNQVEKKLNITKYSEFPSYAEKDELKTVHSTIDEKIQDDIGMESRIGEVGLAWLGSIVLLFGISFMTQYLQNIGYSIFSSVLGFGSVIGVFITSFLIRKSYSSLSNKLNIISHLLLYYVTLRLHFYTSDPLISSKAASLTLLLIIFGVQIFLFNKRKSEFLTGIALILLLVTAFISNTTHFMFSLVTLAAVTSVYFFFRYGWWRLLLISKFFVYISFFLWFFNNMNINDHTGTTVSDQYGILYLFACVSTYSIVTLIRQKGLFPDSLIFISVILNGILFSFLLSVFVFTFYIDSYVGIFTAIALFALLFSVILKKYSSWKFTPAFYALYGFVALSITIFGIYKLQYSFLLLSIQSLLVVSMALWFRSKIIIVMNLLLFLFLLATYHFITESVDIINISFALVSLITARIINWQRERLDIKTELLRDVYLVIAFFSVLYALLRIVPDNYVTLSWTIAALSYFVLSLLLHNIKYRWMAIFTMIATAIYLFIIDLTNVDIVYRIVTFMFLAIISIGVSLYYSKLKKKKSM